MTTSNRDGRTGMFRAKRGTGSVRQRLPDVWEIRVVVGFDAIHNRSVQRSFTVHGDATVAEQRRRELVDAYGVTRVDFHRRRPAPSESSWSDSSRHPTSGSRQRWSLTGRS